MTAVLTATESKKTTLPRAEVHQQPLMLYAAVVLLLLALVLAAMLTEAPLVALAVALPLIAGSFATLVASLRRHF